MGWLREHKFLGCFGFIVIIVLALAAWVYTWRFGPYQDYELDVKVLEPKGEPPGQLQVGVAMRDISPDFALYDTWTDVNQNSKFDEGVDTYEDRNNNGKFDGIWLAGFGTNRPAQGKNDSPWVRAIAFRNNGVTVVMATFDCIGIFHNEYITIRKSLDPNLNIDHVAFSATHVHESADTMKIWSFWRRVEWGDEKLDIPVFGYREDYMHHIQAMAKEAIEEAVQKLQPADMYAAQVEIEPEGFVNDSRKPIVIDKRMSLMRFTKPGTEDTIATFVNWGNHPETLSGDNPFITSDFPHYLREGMENGVPEPNGIEGFGGMCLYFQGEVGGLMTQLHTTVPHRDGQRSFKEASFEKAESLGYNLAIVGAKALRDPALVWKNENPKVSYIAKTMLAEMTGQYKPAIMLGLIHEGYYPGGKSKSEMNAIRVGDVLMLTVPGEIYPEIVNGGIEAKPGNDFNLTEAQEVPPLRTEMDAKAKMSMIIGLGNDEIGYIIPKSQWDNEPPYVYEKSQYGEENSGGPNIAGQVHSLGMDILKEMNASW